MCFARGSRAAFMLALASFRRRRKERANLFYSRRCDPEVATKALRSFFPLGKAQRFEQRQQEVLNISEAGNDVITKHQFAPYFLREERFYHRVHISECFWKS